MASVTVPRLLLAGVGSGCGKSLITLGLAYELKKRGLSVSTCTTGAHLMQATLLRRTSGRYTRCLDLNLISPGQAVAALTQAQLGADIVLIDGRGGLFDGISPGSTRFSDADVAAASKTPVVLVIDCRGLGASIAALMKGYSEFGTGFLLPGAILNRISLAEGLDARNAEFYGAAFQGAGLPAPLGGMPELGPAAGALPPGGITERENVTSLPRQFFIDLSHAVARCIDVEAVISAARTADPVPSSDGASQPMARRTRIGVAEDACFNLAFQDNLDLLRFFGAELAPFSPLADTAVPEGVGGLYFPGGCLVEYAHEIARNAALLDSIRQFANSGGVVFAEGAGAALLCREFSLGERGEAFPGVGLIPGRASLGEERLSYHETTTADESVLGRPGLIVKGVSTNAWSLKTDERVLRVLRCARPGLPPAPEGFSPGAQIVASFSFHHFGSNPGMARSLVDACEVVRAI